MGGYSQPGLSDLQWNQVGRKWPYTPHRATLDFKTLYLYKTTVLLKSRKKYVLRRKPGLVMIFHEFLY
jgi:hypothetical protein